MNLKRCFGCMKEVEESKVCPLCGYSENSPCLPYYLYPNTLLDNRYLIGKLLNSNGESATYIAFDKDLETVVDITEFMPTTLCSRDVESDKIIINSGKETKYKVLLADFKDLNTSLFKLKTLTNIVHIYDVFELNNTCYVVKEHINGVSFKEYLRNNSGELSWFETKTLLSPVLASLDILNNKGIVHRGISPDTLFVNDRKVVKIGGFSISALRLSDSEIAPELFNGFSAPEQFLQNKPHGNWTDVYSMGAVLYKALTGIQPIEASLRATNDILTPPDEINPNVSKVISNAIVKALKYDQEKRYSTVGEFALALFDEKAAISVKKAISETKSKNKKHFGLIAMGITSAVLLIFLSVLASLISIQNNKNKQKIDVPKTESFQSAPSYPATDSQPLKSDEILMPTLLGRKYDDLLADEDLKTKITLLEPTYVYDQTYAKDTVCVQSIKVGKVIKIGAEIKISISKGTNFPKVPPYIGVKFEDYKLKLDELGIKYNAIPVSKPGYESGYIVSVDREEGDTIQIDGNVYLNIEYAQ